MRDFTRFFLRNRALRFFLRNRALSWLLLGLVLAGGLFAYLNMGKLEDAPFTIKQALVTTSYPGASPMEVREQVTDILEEAIQSLGELYYLKTENRAGMSKITVYVKKEIRADQMQQLWDKLRRKVSDVQSKLPAGAGPSVVNDDFGDVLGTAMPLLGATLIAVLTFLPIYLSPHITGELLSSLFIVIAVSLLLSWVLAITQNVFFVQEFVRRPRPEELKGELFSGRAYDLFRRALAAAIRWRYVILAGMVVALLVAGWGFRFIPRQFMPLLNKQYFSIDMWLPEGTRFEDCERQAAELTDLLREYKGVKKVSTFVGQTPPRYYLANAAYGPQPNYAQCLVETETPERSAELRTILYDQLPERFPNALVRVNSFEINSIPQALIEARFCGDDPRVLDSLTNEAIRIMRRNPKVLNARNE